jgi:GT2 family glycosyltransferase
VSAAISVIVPVHGRAPLTRRCLDLVLDELPADAELLVVDDASPDGTPDLLADYGDAIESLRLEKHAGFARACNEGAERASGELLVFLNNDVEPTAGWLEALRRHAEANPQAVAVGAKLLYPNGTVQHAGVVIGQDGYPHHLYAGFPAEHPAVERSRPLQAVTGACLLVRRKAFEAVGGFDAGYLNSLEDVDLCLRLGEAGGEVHYCHRAVLVHLESASRGRSDRFERSVALYRERWRERVRRDDLEIYAADGLLRVEYPASHPLRFEVEPLLAAVDRGREEKIERLLSSYAGEAHSLLQEVVRLTAECGGSDLGQPVVQGGGAPIEPSDHEEFLAKVGEIEEEIRRLQEGKESGTALSTGSKLGYRFQVEAVREAIHRIVPPGSVVLVASRGDRELVRLDERIGWHFPRAADGRYAGHHPADSDEAVRHLEDLRLAGATFLVFPPGSSWWLSHYGGLKEHLEDRYQRLEGEDLEIFELTDSKYAQGPARHDEQP